MTEHVSGRLSKIVVNPRLRAIWDPVWSAVLGVARTFLNRRLMTIAVLFAAGVVLQYPQQILGVSSPSLLSFVGVTRHTMERILLLIPIGYASLVFGQKGGVVSLAVALVLMLPRVFWLSPYFSDALFETIGVVLIGALMSTWFDRSRKEKEQGQWLLSMRYRELFENAHDAIWVQDLEGNLTAVNKATEELTGYSARELLSMNVKSFFAQGSLGVAGEIRRKLFESEPVEQPYEQRLIRRDGSEGILKLTTNLIRQRGQPAGFLHIARDVTREKEMQDKLSAAYQELSESHQRLRESQQQLIQAEKLTSLGQLAASVAHEVNNPLSGVLVYTQLLMKKMGSDKIDKKMALEYLSKMEFELTRSSKLIRNLLDFARQSPPAFRKVNLNEVLERAFGLAAHSAQLQHIETVKELDPLLPDAMADADQLQQVCTNLILNAIQSMPEGGRLTLRTAVSDGHLKIHVQDTGCGISPENMHKLFTPFFTTKRAVKGVGLGLAVAYGIVQRHKGRIDVESKEGQGTTFTICLPVQVEDSESGS